MHKKKCTLSLLLLLSVSLLQAESRFSLDTTTDIILGSAALGLVIPSYFMDSGPQETMDRSEINGLDRQLMYAFDENLDKAGTVLALSALLIPGTSLINEDVRGNWLTYGVMYTEAFLLTMGTKDILKGSISRNRPYTYIDPTIPAGEEEDYYNSFPSGHTAYAFMGAGFLTTTLLYDAPDSKWTYPLIIGSYSIAATVGVLRVAGGAHFVSDVLTGAAIGSLFGWLVPTLHLNRSDELEIIPEPQGVSFRIKY